MNIEGIATGLEFSAGGYWVTPGAATEVSYPPEGNEFCLSVEERSFWFAHRNSAILAAVRRFPPATGPIFDVGAGNGFVSAALADAGFPVVPIEPNAAGASNAARRGLQSVICGTLPSPLFHAESAGAVALFDVIEHVPDDIEFLASLARYVKKRGRVYVTVPAHRWLWSGEDVLAGHQRRYTRSGLQQVLVSAGYHVEFITYMFSWLTLPVLLFRAFPSAWRRNGCDSCPSKRHHTAGGAFTRRALIRSLRFEVSLISRGRRIPFGASCLAVARTQT